MDTLDCDQPTHLNGTVNSAVPPTVKVTDGLDRFKSLIGMPDDYVRLGRVSTPDHHSLELQPAMEDIGRPLDKADHDTIKLAAKAYIFGDSSSVRHFQRAIELRMSPFNVAVYAARHVILRPNASLTLSGPPAVLITRRIDIHADASIITQTVARILSDHIAKVPVSVPIAPNFEEA